VRTFSIGWLGLLVSAPVGTQSAPPGFEMGPDPLDVLCGLHRFEIEHEGLRIYENNDPVGEHWGKVDVFGLLALLSLLVLSVTVACCLGFTDLLRSLGPVDASTFLAYIPLKTCVTPLQGRVWRLCCDLLGHSWCFSLIS